MWLLLLIAIGDRMENASDMVTIKDVAKLAGVSTSTASRAMHDSQMISEATKERVRQAMAELNYSPNYSAQNLVKRDSNTVGIILPVRENQMALGNNPFFMQIIQGISTACSEQNFMVSLATGRSEQELLYNVKNMIRSGNVRRLIFLYSKENDAVFQYVLTEKVPCVVVGQRYGEPCDWVTFVDNDNSRAGQDVTAFLVDKGYQKIAYAYTELAELVQADRYQGYREVMAEENLSEQMLQFPRTSENAHETYLEQYLKTHQVDAFVTSDDMLALRLQRLLLAIGKEPSDYGMISFNNSLMTELASPSLTSVEIFPYQLGELAAKLLLDGSHSTERLLVDHQIIERASTVRKSD